MKKLNFLILVLSIIYAIGCKKIQEDKTVVSVNVFNPVNNEPIENVEYYIITLGRNNSDNFQLFPSSENNYGDKDTIDQGYSNSEGKIISEFKQYKDHDINTFIGFRYDKVTKYEDFKIYGPQENQSVEIYQGRYQFNVEIRITPFVDYVTHFKNKNCGGNIDEMRFRTKSTYFGTSSFSHWKSGYVGCLDSISNISTDVMDDIVTEIEVTRQNGTIDTYIDTSRIGVNEIDTLKIYY